MANADGPILIVGGDGLIGHALHERCRGAGKACVATSRRAGSELQFDLGDPETWRFPKGCSVAFLCASRTRLAECESSPFETARVNVTGTVELARRLREEGVFVIFLSTNLVFDGSKPFPMPGDVTNPTTEYGRQKAEAEKSLADFKDGVAIVRLTKVLHPTMPLLQGWIAALRRGEVIHPYSNMVFSPLSLEFVVDALQVIAEGKRHGIIHLSAEIDVSYASLAASIAHRFDFAGEMVQPVAAPTNPPTFSTLGMLPQDARLFAVPPAAEVVRQVVSAMA